MISTRHVIGTVLLSTAGWASMAAAQTDTPSESELEQVVVTGSRIARRDYESDSPIVTLNQDAIKAAGPATVEAVLNTMPQFAAIRVGSSLSADRGGRNNANLRGLGIGRTLVLLDGRRMQPSDVQGALDLNTIPQAMIKNVEVITGGASATYGSDAIAGVVNFRLNTDFDGLQFDGQYGVSDEGDADSYEFSAIAGSDFADSRGHIVATTSYLGRAFTPRGAREFFVGKLPSTLLMNGVIQADATNLPTQAGINSVFARYGFTGNVPRNATLGVNPDGTLFTASATSTVPVLNMRHGDPPYFIADGTRVAQRVGEALPLQQKMDKYNIFTHASFDVTDSVAAYGQFQYVHYTTEHRTNTSGIREPIIPITNPFIPADLRAVLAARPNPNAPLIYWWGANKVEPRRYTVDTYDVGQGLIGLKGKIPRLDWTWDLYGSYGRTTNEREQTANILRSGIETLLNAPDGGRSICPGGHNPFIAVPLVADPSTRACYDFVHRKTKASTDISQTVAEGSVQGTLFNVPAGELKFAAGVNYRRNSFSDRPDPLAAAGLLVNTSPGQSRNRDGSDKVSEFFAELLVPVLRDVPLVDEFSVSLAGRTSNYDSIGSVETYKAGADWQIIEPVRVRGSYQRAIRAPDLGDLHPTGGIGNVQIGQTAQGGGDPCDVNSPYRRGAAAAQVRSLCLASGIPASVIDIFQFNGNSVPFLIPTGAVLTEETADTYTVGVVLRSPFDQPLLSNLQLSVDYYDIRLEDAIGSITAPITLNLCFNANGGSNPGYSVDNLFCQQIDRDAGGRIAEVQTPRLNLSSYETSGVDIQLDWVLPLSGIGLDDRWGSVALNAIGSYVDAYSIQTFEGDRTVNYTGTIGNAQVDAFSISHPTWRAQVAATWNIADVSATLRARYIPSMFDSLDAAGTTRTRPGVKKRFYYDATASWAVTEDLSVRAGVLNLTDTQPPYFATAPEATDVALYDILGRRFYVGVTMGM